MSTYKVIQDIEAEDHILGPLSLRQFIYGLIATFFLYLSFISVAKHVPFLLVFWLPPALFTGFFAFPFGKDQPTEVWALAKIRFLFKPRKRIWNQSGVKEQVTINVPKKIEIQRTNGLSQIEVRSRLQALADTIDTRGWAIKNVTTSQYGRPDLLSTGDESERLLGITSMPQEVPDFDIPDSADILDTQASPIAKQFTSMINTSTQNHREKLMAELARARVEIRTADTTPPVRPPSPQWFSQSPLAGPQPIVTSTSTDDAALSAQIKAGLAAQSQSNLHLRTINPNPVAVPEPIAQPMPAAQPAPIAASQPINTPDLVPITAVAPTHDPAIMNLAKNNDLNISTLARQASKTKDLGDEEVVISLH